MKIPEQYLPVMPYIILSEPSGFNDFVKKTFNATEQLIVPGEDGRPIMHGEVRIGNAVIMFAGGNEQWGNKTCGMFIYVEDVDEVYNNALANGANSLIPPTTQQYGYSGGFEDPFGNQWWICNDDN